MKTSRFDPAKVGVAVQKLLAWFVGGSLGKGQLTTYGTVGDLLGLEAHYLGEACRVLWTSSNVDRCPTHRVVRSGGRLQDKTPAGVIELLKEEGHTVERTDEGYQIKGFGDALRAPAREE